MATKPAMAEATIDERRARVASLIAATFGVLAQLTGVETFAAGWRARCPCCHVARALTVGLADFNDVGLTCAAGCDPAQVYAAVALPAPQRWPM